MKTPCLASILVAVLFLADLSHAQEKPVTVSPSSATPPWRRSPAGAMRSRSC